MRHFVKANRSFWRIVLVGIVLAVLGYFDRSNTGQLVAQHPIESVRLAAKLPCVVKAFSRVTPQCRPLSLENSSHLGVRRAPDELLARAGICAAAA
jgi:hypothetical protein